MKKSIVPLAVGLVLGYSLHLGLGRLSATKSAPAAPAATNVVAAATNVVAATKKKPEPPRELEIESARSSDDQVTLYVSAPADPRALKSFISFDPAPKGEFSVRNETDFDYGIWKDRPVIVIAGDFLFRTNTTLRVRKGLPAAKPGVRALAADFTHSFTRADRSPEAWFADSGRYLPPDGSRAVRIEAVNLSVLTTTVRRVESANVVQLLAREERVYNSYYYGSVDSRDTIELSHPPVTRRLTVTAPPNEKGKASLEVAARAGDPERGIFLVGLDGRKYRLIAVTDLALNVRRAADGALGVWVTSFRTGAPVAEVALEVYSKENIRLAKGTTDANGWCAIPLASEAEPFVVTGRAPDGNDLSFLALRSRMKTEEKLPNADDYLTAEGLTAFVWTARGIYRHGEKIAVEAIVRNGRGLAPAPLPLVFELRRPTGEVFARATGMTDASGAVATADFAVPDELPGGLWTIALVTPGEKGRRIGSRTVSVEEFVPPRVRVAVRAEEVVATGLTFVVTGEHLFGAPAAGLNAAAAVVFGDAAFAPAGWKGYRFGDDTRTLKPNHRTLPNLKLDARGAARFTAVLDPALGRPGAAVAYRVEGTAYEAGGRPVHARLSGTLHPYPFYLGSTLGGYVHRPAAGTLSVPVALVTAEGRRATNAVALVWSLNRVDTHCVYRAGYTNWGSWDCERVAVPLVTNRQVAASTAADTLLELPLATDGDYELTVTDPASGSAYRAAFYAGGEVDRRVRSEMKNPTDVTLTFDRDFYRVGEVPHLVVKSPFAGSALLTVFRERLLHSRVLTLTNATCVLDLPAVTEDWAPSVDVSLAVVQSCRANEKRLAVRALGAVRLGVRPADREIAVESAARVVFDGEGTDVDVDFTAPGATVATVTVVDEGINLLTSEPEIDPVGYFARPRAASHELYDLYGRLLPVLETEGLGRTGVKSGGGAMADCLCAEQCLFGRVSPQTSRRFKPFGTMVRDVPVADGRGHVRVRLPEFAGTVRVSVLARSPRATGAATVKALVQPALVMEATAPRFAAPNDAFDLRLPVFSFFSDATVVTARIDTVESVFTLGAGASTTLVLRVTAPSEPGEWPIAFCVAGGGERHAETIELPVRPAVAWRETAGVTEVKPGQSFDLGADVKGTLDVLDTGAAELTAAYRWLADYPYGCLEQTTSRVFPLLHDEKSRPTVRAGIGRILSMMRTSYFATWPDCWTAPWDREVTLYAVHFLAEAKRAGFDISAAKMDAAMRIIDSSSFATNLTEATYACLALTRAGKNVDGQLFRLYDRRAELSLLSRARLALALATRGDTARAKSLLAAAGAPDSVREASFALLALLAVAPEDSRVNQLLVYLRATRDRARYTWGTTAENAHALLALGAWHRAHPCDAADAKFERTATTVVNTGATPVFAAWRRLTLPDPLKETDFRRGLNITRHLLDADGRRIDPSAVARGQILQIELVLSSDDERTLNDLVVEDLLPAAFEPIPVNSNDWQWVLRAEARDDRVLVFSNRFRLEKGKTVRLTYPVVVVTAGSFVWPGASVEAMYAPDLFARRAPTRLVVK